MNRLIKVVAASVCAVSLSAVAAEESKENPVETETEETQLVEAGVDLDFLSAYVWRNAIQTDRMVLQPCVWADVTPVDPLYFGFSVWQNYNLTGRTRDTYRHSLSETDYNVHGGYTLWANDEGDMDLTLELGHDWYTYLGKHDEEEADSNPDTREVYAKATFTNPFVTVYGQGAWMYRDFGDYEQGMYYELGFNKEFELTESLALGADWNVGFGDKNYLSYLYGDCEYRDLDDDGEDDSWRSPSAGFGGTTVRLYLNWAVTDWLSVGGAISYTGILNREARKEHGSTGFDYHGCHRDFVHGGLFLKLSY